jgi:hypothetical protein
VGVDKTQLRSVRLIFDQTAQGKLLFSNVRISKSLGVGVSAAQIGPRPSEHSRLRFQPHTYANAANQPSQTVLKRNRIVAITRIQKLGATSEQGYEIEVETLDEFPARNQIPVLHVGRLKLFSSRYSTDNLKRLAFFVSLADITRIAEGAPVLLTYGVDDYSLIYTFGPLRKH